MDQTSQAMLLRNTEWPPKRLMYAWVTSLSVSTLRCMKSSRLTMTVSSTPESSQALLLMPSSEGSQNPRALSLSLPERLKGLHHPPKPRPKASVVTTIWHRAEMIALLDHRCISLCHHCISSTTGELRCIRSL